MGAGKVQAGVGCFLGVYLAASDNGLSLCRRNSLAQALLILREHQTPPVRWHSGFSGFAAPAQCLDFFFELSAFTSRRSANAAFVQKG
jgi:hypothetical protein